MSSTSRLAATLFADISGYTAIMHEDEKKASELLNVFINGVETTIPKFNGEIINYYGDGVLCLFDTPQSAVRCAIDLQKIFYHKLNVPVRIGIHSGTIVVEDDKTYGDSINIASRIESLGVPGAILISDSARKDIRNQPDLKVHSLGKFEFKHLEEPMEVFAISNKGIVVPKRTSLGGKLKQQNKKVLNYLMGAIGLMIIIFLGQHAYFNIYKGGDQSAMWITSETPFFEAVKDKRVAVFPFENLTGDDDLDYYGKLIADNITSNLELEANSKIVLPQNVEDNLAMKASVDNIYQYMAKNISAEIIINGRLYKQENKILVFGEVIDPSTGSVLERLGPIESEKDRIGEALQELTQRIVGLWMIEPSVTINYKSPYKYEAYKLYKGVIENNASDISVLPELEKAYEIDSSFYPALLQMLPPLSNWQEYAKIDSLISYIKSKNFPLTEWDKWRLKSFEVKTLRERAEANYQMYLIDPQHGISNWNAANSSAHINEWTKAKQFLYDYHDLYSNKYYQANKSKLGQYLHSNRQGLFVKSHYMLGEYEDAIGVIDSLNYKNLNYWFFVPHLQSLIRLDSINLMDHYLAYYETELESQLGGIFKFAPLFTACNEFYILDKRNLLEQYSKSLCNKLEKETWDKVNNFYNHIHGWTYFFLQDYGKAEYYFNQLQPENPRGQLCKLGILANLYTMTGNNKMKDQILEKIIEFDLPKYPYYKPYILAQIKASEGQLTEAVQYIEEALNNQMPYLFPYFGSWFTNFFIFKQDPFLKPLFGYPPFEELVKPK